MVTALVETQESTEAPKPMETFPTSKKCVKTMYCVMLSITTTTFPLGIYVILPNIFITIQKVTWFAELHQVI